MHRKILGLVLGFILLGCAGQLPVPQTEQPPSTAPRAATTLPAAPELGNTPPATAAAHFTTTPIPQLTAPPMPSAPAPVPTVPPAATNVRRLAEEVYAFRQWASFDGIPPIYEPQFVPADGAPLQEDELVMGVTLGGQAKAYPITVLQFREMVNDELAGIPILVSW